MKSALLIPFLILISATPTFSSEKDKPLEEKLGRAKLIVIGTITSVDNRSSKFSDIGTLKVSEVLRGDSNLSTIRLEWNSPKYWRHKRTSIQYKKEQSGIWIFSSNLYMEPGKLPRYTINAEDVYEPKERIDVARILLKCTGYKKTTSFKIFIPIEPKPDEIHYKLVKVRVYNKGNSSYIHACKKRDSEIEDEKAILAGEKVAERFWLWVKNQLKPKMRRPPSLRMIRDRETRMEVMLYSGGKSAHTDILYKDEKKNELLFDFIEDIASMCLSDDNAAEAKFLKAHPIPVKKERKEKKVSENKKQEKLAIAKNQEVFITNTGNKFHKAGCRYLKRSSSAVSREDAIKRGYKACKVCKP